MSFMQTSRHHLQKTDLRSGAALYYWFRAVGKDAMSLATQGLLYRWTEPWSHQVFLIIDLKQHSFFLFENKGAQPYLIWVIFWILI